MSKQLTFVMRSLEEAKTTLESREAQMQGQGRDASDLRLVIQQQKELIRQHEATIKQLHQQSVQSTGDALVRWKSLQDKYEEVGLLLLLYLDHEGPHRCHCQERRPAGPSY